MAYLCFALARSSRLFSHVQMHVHAQATRFQVFSLLDALVARHRTSLRTLPDPDPEAPASFSPPGARFARGYVRMAEGEKDPRNLLLAFHIDRVLLVEWEMQEKLVEVRLTCRSAATLPAV